MNDEIDRSHMQFEPSLRDNLFERARIGVLTPRQAEAEAERRDLKPLSSKPGPTEFDPRRKSRWSLAMAFAWIVWRDFEEVRQWDNDYREKCWDWKAFNVRIPDDGNGSSTTKGWAVEQRHPGDGITFEVWGYIPLTEGLAPLLDGEVTKRAKEDLWQALQDGQLFAEGISSSGGARKLVPALEWQDLDNADRAGVGGDRFFYRHERARTAYSDITFRRDDLLRLWSSDQGNRSPTGGPPKRRSGTPNDQIELERWIDGRIAGGQPPPSRGEVEKWAALRGIGVKWARAAHSALPPEKKLKPGEGPSDWQAKRQESVPTRS